VDEDATGGFVCIHVGGTKQGGGCQVDLNEDADDHEARRDEVEPVERTPDTDHGAEPCIASVSV